MTCHLCGGELEKLVTDSPAGIHIVPVQINCRSGAYCGDVSVRAAASSATGDTDVTSDAI